ncbi:MAG: carbohydrate kinase [Deltaproteobacteria bacterium]|nr:carbohydrate kinase [Deltaproteobacteria bacterium]
MILSFGEILYDIFPAYERLGGAPFNFVFHLHSFGFDSRLVSRVGDDERGRAVEAFFLRNHITSDLLQRDPRHPSGTVRVRVDPAGVPDFTIVEDVAYDHIEAGDRLLRVLDEGPALIYFGTLAQRHPHSRSTLHAILDRVGSALLLYDMNLRKNTFSREVIERSLAACHVVKLNDEELKICRGLLGGEENDDLFVKEMMERYRLEWVCLTRGAKGSALYHGDESFRTGSARVPVMVDTVGAGDAYTAILAMGILRGWAPELILDRAAEFAGAVCGLPGAVPDNGAFYRPYLTWKEADKR